MSDGAGGPACGDAIREGRGPAARVTHNFGSGTKAAA